MSKKWVFLDANIYMHYSSITEIAWVDLLDLKDGDTAEIVVTKINLRELDEQKDKNQNRRITDRIRRFLKNLETRLEQNDLRVAERVFLTYYQNNPQLDLSAQGLDPASNDDRLVATILEFRKSHIGDEIVLFAHDTGVRITARGFGIIARDMPERFKAKEEPDPRDAEIKRLREELQRSKNAQPQLSVGFAHEKSIKPFLEVSVKPPLPFNSAEAIWAEEAAKYKSFPSHSDSGLMSFPDFGNQQYNGHLKRYLEDFGVYLRENLVFKNFFRQAFSLEVQLLNSGTAPATDVDVFFTFHEEVDVYTEESLPEQPDRPSPPSRGESIYLNARLPRIVPLAVQFERANRERSGPSVTGSETRFHLERIKHGTPVASPRLWIKFKSYKAARSFPFEYRLEAGNLTASISGELNVKLTQTG